MKKLLILLLMMSSCYSPTKQLNKCYNKSPEQVAEFAREKFPCKITTDSIVNTEYDFIEIQCPDKKDTSILKDTLYLTGKPKTYIIYKDKFVAIPSTTKIVTKYIKDSTCEILLNKSVMDAKFSKEKCDRRGDYINWLLVAFCISFIVNILLLKSK